MGQSGRPVARRAKPTRGDATAKRSRVRPKLPKIDPEMQRWCALLEAELSTWPGVTTRPMFGLVGYYRGGVIFAAIPRTRAVDTPFSLLIKLRHQTSDRLVRGRGPGEDWCTFEMHSEGDLAVALQQLSRAYDTARKRR
jgi:hypothetical protein